MTKNDFLKELEKGLSGLPKNDISERLDFYGEMIDDRMEEGLTESDAVAACGSVDEIVSQALNDIPLKKIVKERLSKRQKIGGSAMTLIIIGFPLWFPILVAAVAVAFSLYVTLWALVVTVFAVALSFALGGLGGFVMAIAVAVKGSIPTALLFSGSAAILIALSVFVYFGAVAATKGVIAITRGFIARIKRRLAKKGGVK